MKPKRSPKGSVLYFNVFLLLLCGCSPDAVKTIEPVEPVLSQQYRQESVTVIVSFSETNITTSGHVQLVLDVQAPPGTDVIFPEVGSFVEPFIVSGSYAEPRQSLPNGKIRYRQVWQLVPTLTGNVLFQPLEIIAGVATIKTEPTLVSVHSILPDGLDTFEIKDIAPAARLLPEQKKEQRIGLILLGIAIVAALAILGRKLRFRPKTIVELPPYKEAFQALENLPDEELPRLQEITRVLLRYIDRRFGIAVTGKTLHELIPTIPRYPLLGRRLKLEEFLAASEQVRFSNRIPDGFTDESEQYVRRFLEETKEEEETP